MRLFLIAMLLLLPGFFALIFLARALGGQQSINPALAGFIEGCEGEPQPCWYGIVPGVTTAEEARQLLIGAGYAVPDLLNSTATYSYNATPSIEPDLCTVSLYIDNNRVTILSFRFCQDTNIQIGVFAAMLGIPNSISDGERQIAYGSIPVLSYVSWSPFERVSAVTLGPFQDNVMSFPWHGFIPYWRFCQLETCSSALG